jgi:tetratricopeptide (TPR) repeat protein
MLKKTIFFLVLSVGCFSVGFAQSVHKPAELLKIMKESKISYTLSELYIDINDKDYSQLLNQTNIYHDDSDGHMVAKKLVLSPEAVLEWNAAEKSFSVDSNFKEARKHYKNVTDIQPEYYPAFTRMGETYAKEKDFEKAISSFKKAISKNYVDYWPHWQLAAVYYKEKNYEDAVSEITLAHILDRNNRKIIESMIEIYADAHLIYDDWVFTPQVTIFKGQKENEIKVSSKEGWSGYAIGKAIWSYEPGYPESQGEKQGVPSLIQEKECLLSLLSTYNLDKVKTADVGVTHLQQAKDNNMMDSFIYYEGFLREQPSYVYQLPNNVIKKMKNYVVMAHGGK